MRAWGLPSTDGEQPSSTGESAAPQGLGAGLVSLDRDVERAQARVWAEPSATELQSLVSAVRQRSLGYRLASQVASAYHRSVQDFLANLRA